MPLARQVQYGVPKIKEKIRMKQVNDDETIGSINS
jgi:hypothetical protein